MKDRTFFEDLPPYLDRDAWTFFLESGVELRRAREKHGMHEETELTDGEWLAILVEEVGECAKAMQEETVDELRVELAQVAAMACRWALSSSLRTPDLPATVRQDASTEQEVRDGTA